MVQNAGNANTELKMSILPICRVGNVYVHRVNRVVFSMFGGLGGDFCKATYEANLFGMHIGNVMSGFLCRKNDDFSIFGDVGGDFVRRHIRQRCLGYILEVF